MNKKSTIVIPADPSDEEDFSLSDVAVERALMGRRIRQIRQSLGLTQEQFANRYRIPLGNIRQYEIGRTLPPPAVRAYLTVIEAEPVITAKALSAA